MNAKQPETAAPDSPPTCRVCGKPVVGSCSLDPDPPGGPGGVNPPLHHECARHVAADAARRRAEKRKRLEDAAPAILAELTETARWLGTQADALDRIAYEHGGPGGKKATAAALRLRGRAVVLRTVIAKAE